MSVKDVIKKSVLNNFQNVDITMKTAALFLAAALLLGIYIFLIYRIYTTNTFYSKSFNISLILMCVLTAAIIITIQSSIVVSLGMVGALSIVRFRTAIKEPMDLAFLYWAISMGILAGAGMLGLSIMVAIIVTLILTIFIFLPEKRHTRLLMVNTSSNEVIKEVLTIVSKYDKKYHTHSRNVSKNGAEILLEINIKKDEAILSELSALDKVTGVSLISHKGDSVY